MALHPTVYAGVPIRMLGILHVTDERIKKSTVGNKTIGKALLFRR